MKVRSLTVEKSSLRVRMRRGGGSQSHGVLRV